VQVKITRSGPRSYLQIVRAYRDPETRKPKQEHIANLCRLDQLGEADLDTLINGLLRVTDRPSLDELTRGITSDNTTFAPAEQLGDVWAVMEIWRQLKLAQALLKSTRGRRHQVDIEKLVRVMVVNRLSDPRSKLGILRWIEQVYLPGIDRDQVTHQNLLRAMDVLVECKDALERELVGTLLPLFDTEMEVVFYDITTIGVEGETQVEGDLRQWGKSKDTDGIARQFAVGLVQTADGFPVTHEVFEGSISETTTVQGIVSRLCERFPVKRLVFVADRGMISLDNLAELESMTVNGRSVEYILAVPARKYREMIEDLPGMHRQLLSQSRETGQESVCEAEAGGRRLVMAHSPEIARRARRMRAQRVAKALRRARGLAGKLNAQEDGRPGRWRRLSDNGAMVTMHHELVEAKLTRLIKLDLKSEIFRWYWNVDELKRDLELDGKLVLISNVRDMTAEELVARYKDLADIERGFRVVKGQLEIAPVYHRLPDRIRAHTFICFLALVIQRVMRFRLRRSGLNVSPEELLYRLRTVQRHNVRLATGTNLTGISAMTPEQRALFEAIGVRQPTRKAVEAAA
jgi:transposase